MFISLILLDPHTTSLLLWFAAYQAVQVVVRVGGETFIQTDWETQILQFKYQTLLLQHLNRIQF